MQQSLINPIGLARRSVFHRTRDSIEAHLTTVFAALAISRFIQDRTGLSIKKFIKQVRPLRSATVAINGTTQTFPPQIPPEIQDAIDAIDGEPFTH